MEYVQTEKVGIVGMADHGRLRKSVPVMENFTFQMQERDMAFLKSSMESLLDWCLRVDTELATEKLQMSSMARKMDKLIAMIREEKWKLNFKDNYGGQPSTIARAEDTILTEACVERPPKREGGHFKEVILQL